MSVVVGKLVGRKLARRRKSRQDGRRAEISITPEGLALIRRAPEPIQQRLIRAIESQPRAARRRLARSLTSVVASAGIAHGPAPLFFEEHTK